MANDYPQLTRLSLLVIQSYERYLPSAFDESMTILQKLNRIEEFVNNAGALINTAIDVIELAIKNQDLDIVALQKEMVDYKTLVDKKHADFEERVITQLLPDNIGVILDIWFANGKLAEIINMQVFDEITNKISTPYHYTNHGIAFDSSNKGLVAYDNHASWTHGTVSYDPFTDEVVFFYVLKPVHSNSGARVLMRKKKANGDFSDPIVVADKLGMGISCKTQSAGIAPNGHYLAIVWEWNGTQPINGSVDNSGAYVYRSTNKGQTWMRDATKLDWADINGFLVLKSGRILIHRDYPSMVKYSDDNGYTWIDSESFDLVNIPSGAIVEPAWCELTDGAIVAYYRENTGYTVKNPAVFTKSFDGGLTWSIPVYSSSIIDFVNSNGHLIFHEDTKMVEFIHHSRYTQPDGLSSFYVSVAKEESVKVDEFGDQIRIDKLAPHNQMVFGSVGDCGYIGAVKDKWDTIHVFYYNGVNDKSDISYMTGKKAKELTPQIKINHLTGERILYGMDYQAKAIYSDFENGGINVGVGQKDSYTTATNRLRSKKPYPVLSSTPYTIDMRSANFSFAIREYDKDFTNLSDTGIGQNRKVSFKTKSNTRYVKLLIKKVDDTAIIALDIDGVLHGNLFNLDKPSVLVDETRIAVSSMNVVANKTVIQSVATSTNADITFDAITLNNNASFVALDGVTGKLKVTETGLYEIILNVTYKHNVVGARQILVDQLENAVNQNAVTTTDLATRLQCSALVTLNAGAFITLMAYQTSGISLDITSGKCVIRKIS